MLQSQATTTWWKKCCWNSAAIKTPSRACLRLVDTCSESLWVACIQRHSQNRRCTTPRSPPRYRVAQRCSFTANTDKIAKPVHAVDLWNVYCPALSTYQYHANAVVSAPRAPAASAQPKKAPPPLPVQSISDANSDSSSSAASATPTVLTAPAETPAPAEMPAHHQRCSVANSVVETSVEDLNQANIRIMLTRAIFGTDLLWCAPQTLPDTY